MRAHIRQISEELSKKVDETMAAVSMLKKRAQHIIVTLRVFTLER
jgi:hypothetical protein